MSLGVVRFFIFFPSPALLQEGLWAWSGAGVSRHQGSVSTPTSSASRATPQQSSQILPTGALPQELTALCLRPAPTAPTPSTAPKEKQSQTPSSVGFSDDPLPRHLPSSALASASVLQPLPRGDEQEQHRDGYRTDRAQGQTSSRTQGQGWGDQRCPEQEPRSLERNPVREGVKTGPLGQEDQTAKSTTLGSQGGGWDHLFNGWVIFHGVYVPQLPYPFVCWWASRLLPCSGYYKQWQIRLPLRGLCFLFCDF